MKYPDGQEARLGDRIQFSNGDLGIVVFSIDTKEYSGEFLEEDWGYLEKGVMVKTDAGALIHYKDSNTEEIFLVERKGENEGE
jgi:hypothetical protein